MPALGSLSATFLSSLEPAHRDPFSQAPDLEEVLRDLTAHGHEAWPEVSLSESGFIRSVAQRLGRAHDPAAVLRAAPGPDLWLACGCESGDANALLALERRFFPALATTLRRMSPRQAFVDEVLQALRIKLFTAPAGGRPAIAEYAGTGSLGGWLRTVVTRLALDQLRAEHGQPASLHASQAQATEGEASPIESQYLKARYRKAFAAAFKQAFASLPKRDRELWRCHFLEREPIQTIAARMNVDRKTVTRWMARSRAHLAADIEQRVSGRLRIAPAEYQSLVKLVETNLDQSIQSLLARTHT